VEQRPEPQDIAPLATLAATLGGEPSETIRRVESGRSPGSVESLLASLRDVVVLHETLGEGGMGVVRRGTQQVLAREVAVKCLRAGTVDASSLAKVLQEALILARLEHPNIVPVYDITLDENQLPRIVMKRVLGDEWSRFIHDEAAARARASGDPLLWHLEVFVQICTAVAYAHSRGIVHLDIKPSNVMLGSFGEVYLLDWGIAMTFDDDADPRIPRLASCSQIVGTPRYLAPEMLDATGARLGTFSDVYLLGSTLFEIVAGRPPHRGASMLEVLTNIAEEDPELPDACPVELAGIVRRCLARDPADRPPSARALAQSVQDFLRHWHSSRRCAEADARRTDLEAAIAETEVAADERRIYEDFGAARFGYAAALEEWPDNADAHEGRRRLVGTVVRWELDRDRPQAAAAALAADPDPDPELRALVEAAQTAALERARALAKLGREHDPSVGQRTRLFVTTAVAFTWLVAAFLAWMLGGPPSRDPLWVVPVGALAILVPAAGLVWWARESLMKTAINRGTVIVLAMVLVAQMALGLLAYPLGLSMEQVQVVVFVGYAFGASVATALIEPRLWPAATAYAAGAAYLVHEPDARNGILFLANLVLFVNCAVIWRLTWSQLRAK
jgi:eukaryotic-like serine/threonine-protein kinase